MLIKLRFRLFSFFVLLSFAAPAFAAEPIGRVADLVGEVWITTSGQKPISASFKQSIYMGDTVETKTDGAIKILFVDDTLLTLKENSKTLITEFLFDSKSKKRKAVFSVLYGKVRTVVGKFFGADQPIEIHTPVAIAGIRGTDLGALVKKKSTTFYCFEGLFEAYNIKFPEQILKVTEGKFTTVLENLPPSELAPIPQEVLEQKREQFDISSAPKSEVKEGKVGAAQSQSAGAQIVQSASKEAATEVPKVTSEPTTTTGPSLLDSVSTAAETQSVVESTTPVASTTSSSTQAEVLPGGSSEVTNPATITITLPTP